MEAALPTDFLLNIANAASSAHPVDQTTPGERFLLPPKGSKSHLPDRNRADTAQEMTMDTESLTLRDLTPKAYIHLKGSIGRKAL